MKEKKRKFKAKVDDAEVDFAVETPNIKQIEEAQKHYNRAFSSALESKAIVRARLNDILVEQGLWDEKKEKTFQEINDIISNNSKKLVDGDMELEEAKKLAIQVKGARVILRTLIAQRNTMDANTAEAQAETARFNYLVSACVVYDDTRAGRPYFKSVEDYINNADTEVARKGAELLAMMSYNIDPDHEKKLPENQFLYEYGFANEQGHLVDEKGRYIDEEGRHIDNPDNRRFIKWLDEKTFEYIDSDGHPVTFEGQYKADEKRGFKPFKDKDGKPVEPKKKK